MYEVKISPEALDDLVRLQISEPKYYEKAKKLIDELSEHPRSGTGHPERLKGYDGEVYSRTISKKHRLIYEITETITLVYIVSSYGHYGDK